MVEKYSCAIQAGSPTDIKNQRTQYRIRITQHRRGFSNMNYNLSTTAGANVETSELVNLCQKRVHSKLIGFKYDIWYILFPSLFCNFA